MRLHACLSLLLVAVALASAIPTPKNIEKKSLVEDAKLEKKSTLPIDEEGKEKDRAKKQASFTVEIKPTAYQGSDCKDAQSGQSAQVNVIPASQPASQIQTVSVVPRQPSAQLQTLNVVPSPQPAQVQTLSVVPGPQPAPPTSSSIVIPAQPPAVQPVHTLHILQSVPQPCAQPAQVSFVQPAPAPQQHTLNIIQTPSQPKPAPAPQPKPAPAPAPQTERIIEIQKPEPEHRKPSQIVNIIQPAQPVPEPTETVSILPVEQECEEQMVVLPSPQMYVMSQPEPQPQLATLVQMPASRPCYHQQQPFYTECNCHAKNLALVSASAPAPTVVKNSHSGPSFKTHLHHLHDHHASHYANHYAAHHAPPPTPIYVYSTTLAAPSVSTVSAPARPSMMVQYNPVQSPITLGRSSAHEAPADAQKAPLTQGRTSTTINLNAGLPGHFHVQNPYTLKGYSNPMLQPGITVNGYPVLSSATYGPYYRQSGSAQYPGVTVQEGSINSPGASEAMDMIQAMASKKVPRETDPNVAAAQEAEESIKAITEGNQETPRSARSEEKPEKSAAGGDQ